MDRNKSQVISHRLSVDRHLGVRLEKGTAFILVVMLVTLLAVIGTMFLLRARVGRMSASAMRQNSELNNAVDTVVAAISQQLVLDTPGVDPNQEYYDYPDANNAWLANLEPYYVANNDYRWRQVSNIFGSNPIIAVKATIIKDTTNPEADADGDGVADSLWVAIPDITTGRGEPVYAAVRVVDNGGMLNVNTAYKFDPCSANKSEIDGSSQLQINLMALSWRPGSKPYNSNDEETLIEGRGGIYPFDETRRSSYENGVIWQYGNPGGYTPFDISDELEIRNRFLINNEDTKTRLEELWTWSFNAPTEFNTPVDSDLDKWFYKAQHDVQGPNDIYSYRHIGTTYNIDRIINPFGRKMINVNRPEKIDDINEAISRGLADAGVYDSSLACQLTANLVDFVDEDSNVTDYYGWYGFERPCVYISELAYLSMPGPNDTYFNHYAIELYKPYFEDDNPVGWVLDIDGQRMPIDWSTGSRRFYVRFFADMNDPNAENIADSIDFPDIDKPDNLYDPNNYQGLVDDFKDIGRFYSYHFVSGSSISLLRPVNGQYIVVDQYIIVVDPNWLVPGGINSIQRDILPHKCIRRLWSNAALPGHTLGMKNNYFDLDPSIIQAHPKNAPLTNIGELGMVFQKNAYLVGKTDTQENVLVDLENPIYQHLFNYLTVIDPADHNNLLTETRIKGRININTAPWFVISQLPWVSTHNNPIPNYDLAKAIVAYRDKTALLLSSSDGIDYISRGGSFGFENIGQLNNVVFNSNSGNVSPNIQYYGRDGVDQPGFPDITPVKEFEPGDGAADDFEERDLIFARISDLVTVRSDVFTAYILVRLGQNGPQKRVMAILDRSDVRNEGGSIVGNVKIRSLYPVPDPR